MNGKKIGRALLFPPVFLLLLLLPAATGLLVYGFLSQEESSPLCIISYVVSFYTLVIWCVRLPAILRCFRELRRKSPHLRHWLEDTRLRVNVTLTGNVLWNGAFALLQLALGFYHGSAWFYSLAGYYFSLAFMRFSLVCYTLKHQPGEEMRQELLRYRACGRVFLLTNLTISTMIFYMICENRVVRHHEITTIALAAYTFFSLTMAIIKVIRYRKYNSPVFSASRAISLASACVSMLTLEGTMLATFGDESMTAQTQRLFLSVSGGAVSVFLVVMAVSMIVLSNQKITCLEKNHE